MDIFTTQLTRVAPNKIKADKLRVKRLSKDASTQSIDDEHDHMDEHERYTVTQQHGQKKYSQQQASSSEAPDEEVIEDIDNELQTDQHKNKIEKDEDNKIQHLDIFV
ncbi:hypothetical protein [Colwellia sp. MEBiC06753]